MMNLIRVLTCAIVGYAAGGISAQVSWGVVLSAGDLTVGVLAPSFTLVERGAAAAVPALAAATFAFFGVFAVVAYRIWSWSGWQRGAAATSDARAT